MFFSQNTKPATKSSLNFHETPPPDIKRTTASNISKNSNHTSQVGTIPLDNIVFEVVKPVSSSQKKQNVQTTEIKRSPEHTFIAPSLLPPGSMQVPFPPLRTKYTEVVIESNLRNSDNNKPQIIHFPVEKIVPIVEEQMKRTMHERIQPKLDSLEKQNTLQNQEWYTFIETFVRDTELKSKEYVTKAEVVELIEERKEQENINSDVTELITKEYVTKSEVIELIEERKEQPPEYNTLVAAIQSDVSELRTKGYVTKTELEYVTKENYASIQSDVTELKTKEYVTKSEVIELIEERKEQPPEYNTLVASIQSDVSELRTKGYVTKTEVIELIEERKENYAAIISEILELELNVKEYVTKKEVLDLMDERKAEVLEVVDGKLYALNMEFLVEKYVTKMIERGENDKNNSAEEDDEPKTKFEEIIQPSVARIIHRVIKYDQTTQHTTAVEDEEVDKQFEVDEVYDMERQEKSHFTDCEAKGNIYNPMYSLNESNNAIHVAADDAIVEMGSVYKGEEHGSFQYENELRKVGENRRWNRFGNGVETGNVIDLFLDKNNRKIYIVGNFKFVNRVPLENIAVYDLNEKKWKHVGEGIPQVATAIAVDEENEIVYVGGVFSKVGKGDCEVKANNVAAYHVKENKWYALGEGLNRDCSSIIFDKHTKKLYAGGSFTQSGCKILKYVAMYDIENNEWQPLNGGSVNGSCRIILKPNDDDLYLGGLFTHAGYDDIHVSYVARYHLRTDSWHSLGGGLQGYCNAITYDSAKNKLYVGGTFTSVGSIDASINANHIAEYDIGENSWNDMDGGLNNIVQSIFYDANNECIYVGGTFTHTFENNIQLNHIARYDLKESKWYCLENHFSNKTQPKDDDGTDNVGLNGICKVMSVDNKSLFIAGSFQIAGNITANSIVRYSLNS
jgi:hypothetical protein